MESIAGAFPRLSFLDLSSMDPVALYYFLCGAYL